MTSAVPVEMSSNLILDASPKRYLAKVYSIPGPPAPSGARVTWAASPPAIIGSEGRPRRQGHRGR